MIMPIAIDFGEYANQLDQVKGVAANLHGGNGLNPPDGKLAVAFPPEFQERYDTLTNKINAYAVLLNNDLQRFKQAANNQVTLDAEYGK